MIRSYSNLYFAVRLYLTLSELVIFMVYWTQDACVLLHYANCDDKQAIPTAC